MRVLISFIAGMGAVAGLGWPGYDRLPDKETGEALASDWSAVAADLQLAIVKGKKNEPTA